MTVISGCQVIAALGSGGMGVVHRGVRLADGRPVAIKCIDADACTDAAIERFRREAGIAGRLQHPNIVAVLEQGQTDQGVLYLVMELLEGEDLATRLRRGRLTWEETVRLGCEAAAGLSAAHAAGVVHRDVKPSNLFLCKDGGVKVLDFGLAISLGERDDARVTAAGGLVGTPAYMSVEQAIGLHDEDARTDVWGLGATLYRAVAGQPPFFAPSPMAQLVRVLNEEPDPLPPDVPRWLADVIVRALAKERVGLWQTMEAFGEALAGGVERWQSDATMVVPGAPDALGQEVRIVSVLLADGVRDPAAVTAAIAAEQGVAPPAIAGRAIGVFGGEAWLGDEAERAVRAALRIRETGGAARLSVATGRATQRHERLAGDAVAAAEAFLSPDGVGVDPETRRRILGGFTLDGGVVRRRRAGAGVVGIRGLGGTELPLVGRDPELALLERELTRVADENVAAGVLVVGPPGIGKSRLRHAFQQWLAERTERITVVEARAEAHRTLQGWHAIANGLRLWAEVPEGTPPQRVRERLTALCPSSFVAEFVGELLGAPFDETPALRTARADAVVMRDQIHCALGDLFDALTSHGPLVLVFEDAQWADAPSVDLLDFVLRRLEHRPFFVVATARPEVAATLLPDLQRVTLAGLSRQALRTIVRSVLGAEPQGEAEADAIADRAGGNPYFAEELALSIREGGESLPVSVEAAVQARLDALPRPEKDLLRCASVLGRRFWVEALRSMGVPDVGNDLGHLRRRELVAREPRARLAGTTELRFRHALVQEVAYASLTEEQRVSLHAAAGRWMAKLPDAPAAEVARHLSLGGEPDEAVVHWQRAALTAFRDGDAPLALEASSRALERMREPGASFRLRLLRVDVLHFLGRGPELEQEIEEAAACAETPVDRASVLSRRALLMRRKGRFIDALALAQEGLRAIPDHVLLLIEAAVSAFPAGRLDEGLAFATRAVEVAERSTDHATLGLALNAVARGHVMAGDLGEAARFGERAIAQLETAGDPRRLGVVLNDHGHYLIELGRNEDGARVLEKALRLARSTGNRMVEGYVRHNLGLALARIGRAEDGRREEVAAEEIARDLQLPSLAVVSLFYRAFIDLEADRPADALALVDRALAFGADQHPDIVPGLNALRALAFVDLGRADEAFACARTALDLLEQRGTCEEETTVWLAAHRAGLPGALGRGIAELEERASKIRDAEARRSFLESPAHAALRRAAALGVA